MKIQKLGLVYAPDKNEWWKMKYAMMPTPVHLKEKKVIRIFFGITDINNFGRTTYLDVSEDNPLEIVKYPDNIILDLGRDGTFDDSGTIPSSIVEEEQNHKLYYVGFQRSVKVPYMLFSGLAFSKDKNLERFHKYSESPIIERTKNSFLSNAAPFVLKENEKYKMWFWEGKKWVNINNKLYINAVISYAESHDGQDWKIIKHDCITPNNKDEFSLGRPWVIKENGLYKMFYSIRYKEKLYRLGYAESKDGIKWQRKDGELKIDVSEQGWDSEMICYPSVINTKANTYLFYNGNNNGETGFGVALIN